MAEPVRFDEYPNCAVTFREYHDPVVRFDKFHDHLVEWRLRVRADSGLSRSEVSETRDRGCALGRYSPGSSSTSTFACLRVLVTLAACL
jgi:hypothetical protein